MSILERLTNDMRKISSITLTHDTVCFGTKIENKQYFLGNYGNIEILSEENDYVFFEAKL